MQTSTKPHNLASKEQLIRELQAFMPYDAQERVDTQQTIAFLQATSAPDCFLRMHLSGHAVASALLLSPDCKKTLLTHHAFLDRWLQFGGHADGSPDMAETAVRETVEESGIADVKLLVPQIIDVEIQKIPDRPERGEPEHLHYDIRYLAQAMTEDFKVSEESHNLRWFSYMELFNMNASSGLLRMAEKWKKYCDENNISL